MADFLHAFAVRDGASVAGWRDARPVPLHDWRARAGAWRALALRTPGAAVALYLEDSLEFGAALFGAWQAGKTVWLCADTLDASCASMAPSVTAFFGQFPAHWMPVQPGAAEGCDAPWQALDPGFEALVVHTSGSTGAAQAVPKRLAQLTAEVATLETMFGAALGDADVVATVSHQHIYGLLFKVLWPLAAGRAVHASSCAFPEQLAKVLAGRPCALVSSPAHLKRLPAEVDWGAAARDLRAVFSSGGPLAPEAGHAVEGLLGRAPVEIYGSSETGGIAWRQCIGGAARGWTALQGVEWRIADDSDQIEVRSPHLRDGRWMRLADRASADGGERFQLLGRGDRLVKIEEKRVSLDAIEAGLMASGLVREARVIACADGIEKRQVLAAFAVPNSAGKALLLGPGGKRALNLSLRERLAGVVESVALPRRWRYLQQMPLDSQGKTTQAALLALLERAERPRLPSVRILEQEPARVLLELGVPADLLYFDGHFGQAPVLAGVVQLDWAILYGRRHFALAPAFQAIHALKFQQVIQPGDIVRLELSHDEQQRSLVFRYFSDAGQHAGGRIMFGPQKDSDPC
jgi:acyl-CoA synthetase (AMP-forming)/AMP-acid ligase II